MEYLKKAAKNPATDEDDTRERVEAMLKDIESGRRSARAAPCAVAGWLDRRSRGHCRGNCAGLRVHPAAHEGRHRVRTRAGADLRRGATREHARVRDRASSGRDCGPEAHPGGDRGLLHPRRTIRAHRLGHHECDHGSGSRGPAGHCVLARGSRPRCAPRHPAHGSPRGRRHDTGARGRARCGVARVRPVHRPCGGHPGRTRKSIRGRSKAHPVRTGGYRSVRRADGDRGHRGRDRGCGDRRERPGGAGGARSGLAGVAGEHLAVAGRTRHAPGPALHRAPGRAQPLGGVARVAGIRRGGAGGVARGGGAVERRLRARAPGGGRPTISTGGSVACATTARSFSARRRTSPTATSPRARTTSCPPGRGALHRGPERRQVHQDGYLAAHDPRRQPASSGRRALASPAPKAWKDTPTRATTGWRSIFPASTSTWPDRSPPRARVRRARVTVRAYSVVSHNRSLRHWCSDSAALWFRRSDQPKA